MSRVELTKALPAQSVPSTLGGPGDASALQNLSWLNIMSEDKHSSAEAKRSAHPTKSFDDMESSRRVPILPRAYQSTKKDSESKAHPFATTAPKTEYSNVGNPSVQAIPAVSKKPPKSPKPLVPPPSNAVKNGNASSSSQGIASIISNWEGRSSLKKPSSDKPFRNSGKSGKLSSDKSSNSTSVNGSFGSISKVADSFTQFTPSDSLRIDWKKQDSLCNDDGEYIKNWISAGGGGPSEYENVVTDKARNHRPFSSGAGGVHSQPKQPTTQQALDDSGAYELINYQPTTAHPVRPNPPNRKPMVVSASAKALKLSHSYVNVDIPSDPEPLPPPVPLKKKRPLVKTPVTNDESDDSELDEEEGNEMHYENWSFLNPREGDQNMSITELEAYVKSRKLQGLKAEYFKIRNKPDLSEMKICK